MINRTRRWGTAVILTAAVAMSIGPAMAQDPRTIGGPVRGSMVLGNLLSTRAMGMGGASIATEGPRSFNPAGLGWVKNYDVEVSYTGAEAGHGPDTSYYKTEVTVPVPMVNGAVQLMGTSISSHTDDSRMGDDTHIWGREFGFAFGAALTDRISIGGAGFPSDPSEVRTTVQKTPDDPPMTLKGRSQSQVGSLRAGTLVRLVTEDDDTIIPGCLNVGAMYTHIIDEWDTRGLPAGVDDDDTAYINVGSVAASYEPCKYAALLFDYEFGRITGVTIPPNVDLIRFGTELRPLDWLQIRFGSNDSRFTTGMGISCPHGWQLDYAYVDGGFEDAMSAFGHATVHSISLSKSF